MPAIKAAPNRCSHEATIGAASAQLAAGNLRPGNAEHGALVSIVRGAAPYRLGTGGAQYGSLLTGIEGAAADRLGAFGAGDGAALAGCL